MAGLRVTSNRNDDNSVTVVVTVPARRNGEVNFGAIARLNYEILTVNPDAFDPVGYEEAAVQHHAAEAPMPPHVEELIVRAETDDSDMGLKAGEVGREHADGAL